MKGINPKTCVFILEKAKRKKGECTQDLYWFDIYCS